MKQTMALIMMVLVLLTMTKDPVRDGPDRPSDRFGSDLTSRLPQDGPKTAHDGPKTAQDGPKTAPRRPKTVSR